MDDKLKDAIEWLLQSVYFDPDDQAYYLETDFNDAFENLVKAWEERKENQNAN